MQEYTEPAALKELRARIERLERLLEISRLRGVDKVVAALELMEPARDSDELFDSMARALTGANCCYQVQTKLDTASIVVPALVHVLPPRPEFVEHFYAAARRYTVAVVAWTIARRADFEEAIEAVAMNANVSAIVVVTQKRLKKDLPWILRGKPVWVVFREKKRA